MTVGQVSGNNNLNDFPKPKTDSNKQESQSEPVNFSTDNLKTKTKLKIAGNIFFL